jgi:hypothetical protein
MTDYIIYRSSIQKEAYLYIKGGDKDYSKNYWTSFAFLLGEKNLNIIGVDKPDEIQKDIPIYSIGAANASAFYESSDIYNIVEYKNFGSVAVYKLSK